MPPYSIPAADAVSYTVDVADVGFASRCRYLVDRPLMVPPLRLANWSSSPPWSDGGCCVVVFAFRDNGVM